MTENEQKASSKIRLAIAVSLGLIVVLLIAKNLFTSEEKVVSEPAPKQMLQQQPKPTALIKQPAEKTGSEIITGSVQQTSIDKESARISFDPLLKELQKAHQENDTEKIKQLKAKMDQYRKRLKKAEAARKKLNIEP